MKQAASAAILGFLLLVTLAGDAGAAQRFAAPEGKGSACFQNAPCSLGTAIGKAKSGDEVIVAPGLHTMTAPASPEFGTTGIDIHGDPAGPLPTVVFADEIFGFLLFGESRLSYLTVRVSGFQVEAASCYAGDLIERVVIEANGVEPTGLRISEECAVRNSLIRANGEDAVAIFARPQFAKVSGPVRNVTAIATGVHSVGIATRSDNPAMAGDNTLDVKNAIASGEENDLRAIDSIFGRAHIAVANSNFDVASSDSFSLVKDLGANQGAPPLFVDAPSGDYREAAGSPTIDAGVADQLGELDLAGNLRLQGPAPDIGAFEVVVPPFPGSAALESLSITKRFVAERRGGPVSLTRKRKVKRPHKHVGGSVTLRLSAAATVAFTVERRRKRPKAAAKGSAKRASWRRIKGSFSFEGATGASGFTFRGRLAGRTLKPGAYRLTGRTGSTVKRARFRIIE